MRESESRKVITKGEAGDTFCEEKTRKEKKGEKRLEQTRGLFGKSFSFVDKREGCQQR